MCISTSIRCWCVHHLSCSPLRGFHDPYIADSHPSRGVSPYLPIVFLLSSPLPTQCKAAVTTVGSEKPSTFLTVRSTHGFSSSTSRLFSDISRTWAQVNRSSVHPSFPSSFLVPKSTPRSQAHPSFPNTPLIPKPPTRPHSPLQWHQNPSNFTNTTL